MVNIADHQPLEDSVDTVLVERSGQYELVDSKLLEAERHLEQVYNIATAEESPASPLDKENHISTTPPNFPPTDSGIQSCEEEGTFTVKSASTTALPDKKPSTAPAAPLKSISQSSIQTDPYKGYERISRPRSSKRLRPASAVAQTQRKKEMSDKEAIEKKEMAEAAFEHWKKQKDKESIRRRREEKVKETRTKEAWGMSSKSDAEEKSEAFKKWLQNKSRQRTEERQVERVRAQLITAELLNVNYTESESAYERWLKRKNRAKVLQKKERCKRSEEDREQMKVVLHSLKTRPQTGPGGAWRTRRSPYMEVEVPRSLMSWSRDPLSANHQTVFVPRDPLSANHQTVFVPRDPDEDYPHFGCIMGGI